MKGIKSLINANFADSGIGYEEAIQLESTIHRMPTLLLFGQVMKTSPEIQQLSLKFGDQEEPKLVWRTEGAVIQRWIIELWLS